MKINAKSLRKVVPLVKEYSENVGKHPDQPLIRKGVRAGNDQWMGNAVLARISRSKLIRSNRSWSYCSGEFFRSEYTGKQPILIQVQDCFDDLNYEAYREYIRWVVNDSPWASVFLTKNINTILKRKVVVIDGNNPRWLKKEATIAVRMAWEDYYQNNKYHEVGLWWDLAQKVNPSTAYIAGKMMATPKRGATSLIIKKTSDEGHCPINYYGGSDPHITGWWKKNANEHGWAPDQLSITDKIRPIFPLIGSKSVKVNPFGGPLSKEYKREEFIEAMHSELPKLEASFV